MESTGPSKTKSVQLLPWSPGRLPKRYVARSEAIDGVPRGVVAGGGKPGFSRCEARV